MAVSNLGVGWTPLIESERLAERWGVGRLWIKDEGRQPTASLKDRASAVALARAAQEGAETVTTASTGNAAAALAGLAAGTGQMAVIFVPETAPEAKVAQLLAYGAFVMLVEGTYDDAFRLCQETVERFGWYNRNTGINPYVGEGKKTVALEIRRAAGLGGARCRLRERGGRVDHRRGPQGIQGRPGAGLGSTACPASTGCRPPAAPTWPRPG